MTFPSSAYPTTGAGCVAPETFTALNGLVYLPRRHHQGDHSGDCAGRRSRSATAHRSPRATSARPLPSVHGRHQFHQLGDSRDRRPKIRHQLGGNSEQPGERARGRDHRRQRPGSARPAGEQHPDHSAGGPTTFRYTLDDGTTGTATGVKRRTAAPAGRRHRRRDSHVRHAWRPQTSRRRTPGTRRSPSGTTPPSKPAPRPGDRTNTATATMSYPNNPELGTITPTGSPATRRCTSYVPGQRPTPSTRQPDRDGHRRRHRAGRRRGGVDRTTLPPPTSRRNDLGHPQYVFLAPLGWNIKPNGATLATTVPGRDIRLPDGHLRRQQLQRRHRQLARPGHQHRRGHSCRRCR